MKLRDFVDTYESASGYRAKRISGGYIVKCKAHDDGSPSLSISEGNKHDIALHCHAGCEPEDILTSVGLTFEALFPPKNLSKNSTIVTTYPYCDEDGVYLYEVVRFEPKALIPRRQSKKGDWVWSLTKGLHYQRETGDWYKVKGTENEEGRPTKTFTDVQKVVYNLPLLYQKPDDVIYIVGGEKDADNLVKYGLLGTTNQGGEGKWSKSKEFNAPFQGRRVVILPDNDDAGMKHAKIVQSVLSKIAMHVQIIELDGLEYKQDFSDWIKEHEIEELLDKVYGTELPNARTMEEKVLKEVFQNNGKIIKVIGENIVEAFYFKKHRDILNAMIECKDGGLKIDVETVANKLGENLIPSGGKGYLEELCG